MSKKWTTTQLITLAGLAAVCLVIALFGSVLQAATGIIGANIFIIVPLSEMIKVFGRLLIRKFGAATIISLIYGIGALPLATLGPPGFLPKIFISFSGGLMVDIIFTLLHRRSKLAAIIAPSIAGIIIAFEVVGFGLLFSVPGLELAKRFLFSPLWGPLVTLLIIALSGIGGYLGWLVYNRLKTTAIVKRIQA